jgi:signal transduction histidine kinase
MSTSERLLRDLSLLLELCLATGEQDDLDRLAEELVERAVHKIGATNALLFVREDLVRGDRSATSRSARYVALPERRARYLLASREVDGVTSGLEAALAIARVAILEGSSSVTAKILAPGVRPPARAMSLPIRDAALLEIHAMEPDALDAHTGKVLSSLAGWLAHRIASAASHGGQESRIHSFAAKNASLEELITGLPGLVWRLDGSSRPIYVGGKAEALLGLTRDALLAMNDPRQEVMRELDRERISAELSQAVAAGRSEVTLSYKVQHPTKQGESVEVEERVALSYADRGRLESQVGFLSDMTVAKAAIRRIEQVNAQRTVSARADALRVDTERASRAKTEFLNLLSHELRAPLFPIIALSDLLLRIDDTELRRSEWREQVRMINGAGKQMLQLVSDLLDISRIDSGRLRPNPGPVVLWHFLETLEQRHADRAKGQGSQLETRLLASEQGGEIYTDRTALERIASALLAHTIEGMGSPKILVEAQSRPTSVLLRVSAQHGGGLVGAGDAIFEPFWERPGASRPESRSHSLALAVVKRTVQAFGGRAYARIEGDRLVIEAELPCAYADVRLAFSKVPRAVIGSSDLAAVFGLGLNVLAMGADLRIVPSVGELVDLSRRHAFELLLLDVRLPGIRVIEELLLAERVLGFRPHVVGLSRAGDPLPLTGVVADEALVLPATKRRLADTLMRFV